MPAINFGCNRHSFREGEEGEGNLKLNTPTNKQILGKSGRSADATVVAVSSLIASADFN